MWDLNVKSTFFLIAESFDLLKKAGIGANIMVISSIASKAPPFMFGVYGMTKAALDNMVWGLSKELMEEDIRINGVAPGLIMTEFSGNLWKGNTTSNKRSMGTSEEIGSAVATICSKDGSFMNGEVYPVHGGFAKL